MKKILIGVITCKRPEGLKTLLKSLSAQNLNDKSCDVEICIVDNACMEQTKQIVTLFNQSPFQITLINQPKKGIVYARNSVVEFFIKQDFEALLFIDDDEWTKDDYWIQNLLDAQKTTGADIVTSDVISIPEDQNITWTAYALDRQKNIPNLSPIKNFYTGNVLIRRKVLESIQPAFDERFALSGSSDLHFSMKCRKADFKIIYTDTAPAFEIFPVTRAHLKWFFLRGFRNGSGATRSEMYTSTNKLASFFLCILYAIARMAKACILLIKAGLKMDKGILAMAIMRAASSVGTIMGLFGIKYEEYKKIHGK